MPKTSYNQAVEELTFLLAYLHRIYSHSPKRRPSGQPWTYKYLDNDILEKCTDHEWIAGYSRQQVYFNRQSKMHARELLEKYQIEDSEFDKDFDYFEREQDE